MKPTKTGAGLQIGVRLQPGIIARIDEWRKRQDVLSVRTEAIRILLTDALDRAGVPSADKLPYPYDLEP